MVLGYTSIMEDQGIQYKSMFTIVVEETNSFFVS